jgi:hypothetical protein
MSRLFFKLHELAEKWGEPEITLLHWGASGKMVISACLDILEATPYSEDFESAKFREQIFVRIKSKDLLRLAVQGSSISVSGFQDSNGKEVVNYTWMPFNCMYCAHGIEICSGNLLVMPGEVLRMEEGYPELLFSAEIEQGDKSLLFSKGIISESPRKKSKLSLKPGGRPTGPFAAAVEMAYLHFHRLGNVDILKPRNVRAFLRSL